MVTVTTLPRSGPITRADLDAVPDDGHRYELIDGVLVVTPAPTWRHQQVVGELFALLRRAIPADCRVFVAPMDVVLADDTVMQPDLLVARRSDLGERDLPTAPLLAVEVLSPSTHRMDVTLKRARYEAAGCSAYWTMDPATQELVAWSLHEGGYVEVARVIGDEEYVAQHPFGIAVRPSGLVID